MRYGRGNRMWMTMETLRNTMWQYPALVPPMPHLGGTAPSSPRNVVVEGNTISWDNTETSTCPSTKPRYFVIYRSENERININNPANIVAIVPAVNGQISYTWEIPGGVGEYYYVITAVNRLHDESLPGR